MFYLEILPHFVILIISSLLLSDKIFLFNLFSEFSFILGDLFLFSKGLIILVFKIMYWNPWVKLKVG